MIKANDIYYMELKKYKNKRLITQIVDVLDSKKIKARFKILDISTSPKIDEIEKATYVKLNFEWYENRFLPLDKNESISSQIEYKSKIQYSPNRYGMLFIYIGEISKKAIQKMQYLGNYNLSKPKDEFTTWDNNYLFFNHENIEESIMDSYRLFNLEQSELFDTKKSTKAREETKRTFEQIKEQMIRYKKKKKNNKCKNDNKHSINS